MGSGLGQRELDLYFRGDRLAAGGQFVPAAAHGDVASSKELHPQRPLEPFPGHVKVRNHVGDLGKTGSQTLCSHRAHLVRAAARPVVFRA